MIPFGGEGGEGCGEGVVKDCNRAPTCMNPSFPRVVKEVKAFSHVRTYTHVHGCAHTYARAHPSPPSPPSPIKKKGRESMGYEKTSALLSFTTSFTPFTLNKEC
jgi:hypothetical protein